MNSHMGSFYWILAAGVIFGLVHSGLASTTAKEMAAHWFGERIRRYYRLYYSIIGILTTLIYIALILLLPDRLIYRIPLPWRIMSTLLQAGAVILAVISFAQLGKSADFLGLDALKKQPVVRRSEFITSGFYARVRHPLYDCIFIFLLAMPAMSWNMLAFTIGVVGYTITGAFLEERKLLQEFGEPYREYMKKTPMFIPLRLK
jgi:protein-S-isoprenylcysteine O-methyltransferase Ste14